jgi:hypothetical protein
MKGYSIHVLVNVALLSQMSDHLERYTDFPSLSDYHTQFSLKAHAGNHLYLVLSSHVLCL